MKSEMIYDLKCNGLTAPRGIGTEQLRFSCRLRSDDKGKSINSFVIRIYHEGRDVWSSKMMGFTGKVDACFTGGKLCSHTEYCWSVALYDVPGKRVSMSESSFTTGNLTGQWFAGWIEWPFKRKPVEDCINPELILSGQTDTSRDPVEVLNPPVFFRKEFRTEKRIDKAYAYVTARGLYRLYVNGVPVSDLLAPEYTSYPDYLDIQQYDITDKLSGENHCLGLILADGWFTGKIGLLGIGNQYGENNAVFFELRLFYSDGSSGIICSDESFKCSRGYFDYADLFVGERRRFTANDHDWLKYGFDDGSWLPVAEKDYGYSNFKPRCSEPVKIIRTITDCTIIRSPAGELILDSGENIAGWLRITIKGRAGMKVGMTHSEVLDQEGNFLMNIIGQNKNQTDILVFESDSTEVYEPRFTYHGFRYVKLDGISEDEILDVQVQVIATALQRTGYFQCSNPLLNKLHDNIYRSQQSNMVSIPTDCPQREKAGWTGDMQVYAATACFNMDMYSFLDKWLENMAVEQREDGQIPNIIPLMDSDKFMRQSSSSVSSAAWGDACIIIPYTLYRFYGRIEILEKYYPMMAAWLEYVRKGAAESVPGGDIPKAIAEHYTYLWNTGFHFGDWLYPSSKNPFGSGEETKEYVAPAYFAYSTALMGEIAEILGRYDEAAGYKGLNDKIKKAYATVYFNADLRLPLELQGLYVLALATGCYPEGRGKEIAAHLADMIEQNNGCLDTGFASIGFLLDVLYNNGYEETAYKLLYQENAPSWLYEINMGATSIWENWFGILPDGTRQNFSFNHFAYGCVGDFIYRRIGGLYSLEPGFKRVVIAPDPDCGLTWARISYESVYGNIFVEWVIKDDLFHIKIILPPGVTGTLCYKDNEILITKDFYEFPYMATDF